VDVPVTPSLLLVALVLAHAAIHMAFLAPRPPATAGGPEWPFALDRSWILGALGIGRDTAHLLGIVFVALTLSGFAVASIGVFGFGPTALWPAGVTVGALGSLALLLTFFDPLLVLGVAIDLVLLWSVLVAGWPPGGFTGQ